MHSNVQLELLNKIVVSVAHDLNNPNAFIRLNITNIRKMLNLIAPCLDEYEKNHPDDTFGPYSLSEIKSKLYEQCESIVYATIRMISIVDKLKESTKCDISKLAEVSLAEIASNTLEMHHFLIDGKVNVQIIKEKPDHSYIIQGHKLHLEQALSILFTNACDALRERHGELTPDKAMLELSLMECESGITLSLTDNGAGMDDDTRQKIFTPYYTTKPQGVGEGLGLSLCQSIIDSHNGQISVESTPGKGTTFRITFKHQRNS